MAEKSFRGSWLTFFVLTSRMETSGTVRIDCRRNRKVHNIESILAVIAYTLVGATSIPLLARNTIESIEVVHLYLKLCEA